MKKLLEDKSYDANEIRKMLAEHKIDACIPSKYNRKEAIPYEKKLYKKRHVIENLFEKLKDWGCLAIRYNRCAHTFHSFVCIALATGFF